MPTITGSCLCGRLRFSAPLPSLWMAHCHCTLCQKNAGAAFVTWAGFKEVDVAIENTDNTLKWYSSTENAYRGFCSQCGSTIFFKSSQWLGELHITAVNIHQPLDRKPQANVHWDTHQPWIGIVEQLPKND